MKKVLSKDVSSRYICKGKNKIHKNIITNSGDTTSGFWLVILGDEEPSVNTVGKNEKQPTVSME